MITLRDAAGLIADEAERDNEEPLFTIEDVEHLGQLWKEVEYHQVFSPAPGTEAMYVDAGHILGSASIRLTVDGAVIVFSGDLGNQPTPLLAASECLYGADAVVIESTYGNREHESDEGRHQFLKQAIRDIVARRGTLLIPAFAIERTQELLYELNVLHAKGEIPPIPVFLDSPMAIKATEVFTHFENLLHPVDEIQGRGLFSFPGLVFTSTSNESKHIRQVNGPKIVIAGSGMMNGGRILHHLKEYLGRNDTILLIVGFQVEGSLGRRLHEGEEKVKIFGQEVPVRADIRSCGAFSGHADQPQLLKWLHCFDGTAPKQLFITHGEERRSEVFKEVVQATFPGLEPVIPQYGGIATVTKR
jgi:metallo-beta-lactamase family protein